VCSVVPPLSFELPQLGNDVGGGNGKPYDGVSMGPRLIPELDKDLCPHLKPTNDSWRVDETYIAFPNLVRYSNSNE